MSLYHHVKDLVSTEIGHWNRKDVALKIDKVCNKLVKTSEIRRILLNAKDNILSDNLGDAKQKFEHVNNMDKLEQIVKNEEKHFNVKKTLVGVIMALGLYTGNASAAPSDFAHNVINIHTDNGDVVLIKGRIMLMTKLVRLLGGYRIVSVYATFNSESILFID